jgi:hypothetical protein
LGQIEELIEVEKEIEKFEIETIPSSLMRQAKEKGYADRQIAHLLRCLESEVHKKRREMGINRVYKLVDTCAAEFEAKTPYYYSTFDTENESVVSSKRSDCPGPAPIDWSGNRLKLTACTAFWPPRNVVSKRHDQLQSGNCVHRF